VTPFNCLSALGLGEIRAVYGSGTRLTYVPKECKGEARGRIRGWTDTHTGTMSTEAQASVGSGLGWVHWCDTSEDGDGLAG
jgi:hypothetical protein